MVVRLIILRGWSHLQTHCSKDMYFEMVHGEHGEDELEKMSEASFLDKAKFIMKHNINNQPPFCSY